MKYLKFLGVAIVLLGIGYIIYLKWPKRPSGWEGFNEVVLKRKLHLVEYKYHDVIFLHKNDNERKKLLMIIKYPVSVSASVDLRGFKRDSANKVITLPKPVLEEPKLDLISDETEIKAVRNGFLVSFGGARGDLLKSLVSRMRNSRNRIIVDAEKRGIIKQASTEAKGFIEDLLFHFSKEEKYDVVFSEKKQEIDNLIDIEFKEKIEASIDSLKIDFTNQEIWINIEDLNIESLDYNVIEVDNDFENRYLL